MEVLFYKLAFGATYDPAKLLAGIEGVVGIEN